jgi:hypothetical protein
MYLVHGTTEIEVEASSVVGVVASFSKGVETSSIRGVAMAADELETDTVGGTKSISLTKREC